MAAETLELVAPTAKSPSLTKALDYLKEIVHANSYTNFGPTEQQFARLSRTSRRMLAMAGTDMHAAAAEALPTMLNDASTLTRLSISIPGGGLPDSHVLIR